MIKRAVTILLFLATGCLSTSSFAQDADKDALKKKIDMAIRRMDLRIDKINKDMAKMTDEKSKEQSGEYKAKLQAAIDELNGDLKKLPSVAKEAWKDFAEDVEEHLAEARTDIKPTQL